MILNVKQILEKGILIPNGKGKPAQVGYDLTLKDVTQIVGGVITKEASNIASYRNVDKKCIS